MSTVRLHKHARAHVYSYILTTNTETNGFLTYQSKIFDNTA